MSRDEEAPADRPGELRAFPSSGPALLAAAREMAERGDAGQALCLLRDATDRLLSGGRGSAETRLAVASSMLHVMRAVEGKRCRDAGDARAKLCPLLLAAESLGPLADALSSVDALLEAFAQPAVGELLAHFAECMDALARPDR